MIARSIKRLSDRDSRGFLNVFLVSFLIIAFMPFLIQPIGYCDVPATSHQTWKQLALDFLEHVAGMNVTAYNATWPAVYGYQLPGSAHYQTNVDIKLQNENNTLNFRFTYMNGTLWTYELLDASPAEPMGAGKTYDDALLAAIQAAEGYHYLFNLNYCDGLSGMISTALQKQSLVVENNDALLNISYAEKTDLVWFKKILGQCTSPFQTVSMVISQNGFLTNFMDNLAICPVATTCVNVSQQEAFNTAMPIAQAYANQHGQQIVSTKTTLSWMKDSDRKHGDDDFAIYPVWYFQSTFDKTNEEHAISYSVTVWADNGQIAYALPEGFKGSPKSNDSPGDNSYPKLMFAALAAVLALMCVEIYLRHKGRRR